MNSSLKVRFYLRYIRFLMYNLLKALLSLLKVRSLPPDSLKAPSKFHLKQVERFTVGTSRLVFVTVGGFFGELKVFYIRAFDTK